MSNESREFNGASLGIFRNLAELVIREIEVAAQRAKENQQSDRILAAMDACQGAFLLVDTCSPSWNIMHLNSMAAHSMGAPYFCDTCA